MDEQSQIGRNVAKLRQSQKKTQLDLALDMGVDRSYVSLVETGRENLTIQTLVKIANALDCKIDDLVKTK